MRQTIEILMSSGETDTWHRVHDAAVENGALHILEEPTDDSQLDRLKTVSISSETAPGHLPPGIRTITYLLRATYAPGMWMKVVFLDPMVQQ